MEVKQLWHRLTNGHWPLYRYLPVTDHLAARTCMRCMGQDDFHAVKRKANDHTSAAR